MVTVRQSHSSDYHPGGTSAWLASLGLPPAKADYLLAAEHWLHEQDLTDALLELQTGW